MNINTLGKANKICVLLIILFFLQLKAQGQLFTEFKSQIQQKLIYLRDRAEQKFTEICQSSTDLNGQCPTLSYDMCSGIFQKQCILDFPTRTSCVGEGSFLSPISGIRFPNHIYEQLEFSDFDKKFVCSTAMTEEHLNKIAEDRNFRFGLTYLASRSGAVRIFPSFSDIGIQGCTDYDHRVRSWYINGLSGYKNLIIVLDNSINTSKNGSIGAGITNIKAILDTAGSYDYIQILTFNSETSTIYQSQFSQMSEQFRQAAVYQVAYITSSQKPANYQKVLTKIGQIIQTAKHTGKGAPCQNAENIIFFMSAGIINQGLSTPNQLKQIINKYAGSNKINFFTYLLGNSSDTAILQELSCEFDGMMFNLSDSNVIQSQIITMTDGYYNLIYSEHIRTIPYWSNAYDDIFGYGKLITVSIPVYLSRGQIRQYLALVAIDIQVSHLETFGFSLDQIEKQLHQQLKCEKFSFSKCDLQKFRYQNQLPICKTPSLNEGCIIDNSLCDQFQQNFTVLVYGDSTDINQCCSLSIGGVIGIIIGTVALFLIIGLCVYRYRKKKLRKLKRREKRIQQIKKSLKRSNKRNSKKHKNLFGNNKISSDIQNMDNLDQIRAEQSSQVQRSDALILQDIDGNIPAQKQNRLLFQGEQI